MKKNVQDLEGYELDWAVAIVAGVPGIRVVQKPGKTCLYAMVSGLDFPYQPSTDWAQGGPLAEGRGISIVENLPCSPGRQWEARPSVTAKGAGGFYGYGPTMLTAAMRCYVGLAVGEEIELPCPVCGSRGFEPSKLPGQCTFCDGTEGGNPPA